MCKQLNTEINSLRERIKITNEKLMEKSLVEITGKSLDDSEYDNIAGGSGESNMDIHKLIELTNYVDNMKEKFTVEIESLKLSLPQNRKASVEFSDQKENEITSEQINDNILCAESSVSVTIDRIEEHSKEPVSKMGKQTATGSSNKNFNRAHTHKLHNDKNNSKVITGKSAENVVFSKKERKWLYTDRFRTDFKLEDMQELLYNKFSTSDFIIEMRLKTDYNAKEKYHAFKIGVPSDMDNNIIFDSERWPNGIQVKFSRDFKRKIFTRKSNRRSTHFAK